MSVSRVRQNTINRLIEAYAVNGAHWETRYSDILFRIGNRRAVNLLFIHIRPIREHIDLVTDNTVSDPLYITRFGILF